MSSDEPVESEGSFFTAPKSRRLKVLEIEFLKSDATPAFVNVWRRNEPLQNGSIIISGADQFHVILTLTMRSRSSSDDHNTALH